MNFFLYILFDVCALGLYNWLGKQLYGPDFVNKDKKQPLHRRIWVTVFSLATAIVIILIVAYLIMGIIALAKFIS